MSKKIIGLILAVIMMFTSAVPALADDTIDPDVQAFYDACVALQTAVDGDSVDAINEAFATFEGMELGSLNFDDDQLEDLEILFGEDYEDKALELLEDIIIAGAVAAIDEVEKAYLADKNVKTAVEYMELYESFYDPEYADEEFNAIIERFFPDMDTVYADAKANGPSEEAKNLYDAYNELILAFEMGMADELELIIDDATAAVEAAAEMDDAKKAEVATLLEMEFDEVIADMQSDLDIADKLLEINEVYNAYYEESTEETAQNLVDVYEDIYVNADDELLENIDWFFMDLTDLYDEATALLEAEEDDKNDNKNDDKNDNKNTNSDKKDNNKTPATDSGDKKESNKVGKSPKTGDNTHAVAVVMFLMSGAVITLLLANAKKIKE